MTPAQITPEARDAFNASLRAGGYGPIEWHGLPAALAAVMNRPEIRQALHDEIRQRLTQGIRQGIAVDEIHRRTAVHLLQLLGYDQREALKIWWDAAEANS